MTFNFIPAEEVERKSSLIIGLSGLSGSGKTYSALWMAQMLAKQAGGPVMGIDTENNRMADYNDTELFPQLNPYQMTPFEEPFGSDRYIEAVMAADKAGAGCIIIDSGSDEWESEGGVLDSHEKHVTRMSGGDDSRRDKMNFAAWAKVKPQHKKFANTIFRLSAHLIICFRAEKKTAVEKVKGKQTIVDKGLQPICGSALPYKLRFHLLMTERGNGLYEVLKAYEHEHHVFPPGGKIDQACADRLLALVSGQKPAKKAAPAAKKAPQVAVWSRGSDCRYTYNDKDVGSDNYWRGLFVALRNGLNEITDGKQVLQIMINNNDLIMKMPPKGRAEIEKLATSLGWTGERSSPPPDEVKPPPSEPVHGTNGDMFSDAPAEQVDDGSYHMSVEDITNSINECQTLDQVEMSRDLIRDIPDQADREHLNELAYRKEKELRINA